MVVPRQKGSRVIIYFNDFEQLNENCVEIQVRKAFDVRDAKDSGVKIYDYNDKRKYILKLCVLISISMGLVHYIQTVQISCVAWDLSLGGLLLYQFIQMDCVSVFSMGFYPY